MFHIELSSLLYNLYIILVFTFELLFLISLLFVATSQVINVPFQKMIIVSCHVIDIRKKEW